jgi:peptidyl-prolyl cis-trans isomerase C
MNNISKNLLLVLALVALPAQAEGLKHRGVVDPSAIVEYLMGDQKNSPNATERRELLRQQLLLQDLLMEEVGKLGLSLQPEVKVRLELAMRTVLEEAYWSDYFSKHPIKEDDLLDAYMDLKAANGNKQYRISQIFVKSESEAMQVLEKLKQNHAFVDLVKEYSLDEATRAQGGDLGWQWKSNLTPSVISVIESLKTGNIVTSPVATTSGFVVLKLDEVRDQEFPTYDSLRSKLETAQRVKIQQEQLFRLGKLKT